MFSTSSAKMALRHRRLAPLLLAALVLVACPPTGVQPSELVSWGLPGDLADQLSTLEELELRGKVDHLDWLRRAPWLHSLTLDRTRCTIPADLPDSLRQLSVYNHPDFDLSRLPAQLTHLALGWNDLRGVRRISELDRLEALTIEGPFPLKRLEFPPVLRSLTLRETNLDLSRTGLLHSLRRLTIQNSPLPAMDQLPADLGELTLVKTSVTRLDILPPGLRSLTLTKNTSLSRVRLPRLLRSLTLDQQSDLEAGELPSHLRRLWLVATPLDFAGSLPTDLTDLTLRTHVPFAEVVAPLDNLRILDVDTRHLPELGPLPGTLRELTMFKPPDGLVLPTALRQLDLRYLRSGAATGPEHRGLRGLALSFPALSDGELASFVGRFPELTALAIRDTHPEEGAGDAPRHLPPLPATLQELDLTRSDFDTLGTTLPTSLQVLIVPNTGLTELPPLPPGLRVLDISNTSISDLSALADKAELEELTIHAGQLAELGLQPAKLRVLRVVEPVR